MNTRRLKSIYVMLGLFTVVLMACSKQEELPSIQQRVDTFNKAMMESKEMSKVTEQDMALMKKSADDLAKAMPAPGLKVGEKAPDFTLPNANGKPVTLSKKLSDGPVVLTFYRGAWCPYCNIELHALKESMPQFDRYNAQIVAVSPQQPDKSLEQVNKDGFPFELLSDLDDNVSKQYNLYYEVPADLNHLYKSKFKLDIEAYNGKGRTGLPVPGTFVIDTSGTIVAAFADVDYKKRMEPTAILEALKKIGK